MTDNRVVKPTLSLAAISISAPEPRVLAAFYSALLDWVITAEEGPGPGEPIGAGWAQVTPPPGTAGPAINIEWEPSYDAPIWPSRPGAPQAQAHLDIAVGNLDAAQAWAEQSGARLADEQPQEDVRVMLDPIGHPFCLFHVAAGASVTSSRFPRTAK